MTSRLLMGPQRPERYLGEAIARSSIPEGSMAIITAGWQEGEDDIEEVEELVGRPLENLALWARTEELFHATGSETLLMFAACLDSVRTEWIAYRRRRSQARYQT